MSWKSFMLATALGIGLVAGSAHAEPLQVMSFNIRGDFDEGRATDKHEAWNALDGKHRRDLVIKLFADSDADIIGVQEAYRNQVDDLQQAVPKYDFYGVGRDDGKAAGEHSGIFYRADRFQRADAGTFWLSNTPDSAGSQYPGAACVRIASWAVLEDQHNDNRQYLVLNTHWDHVSQPARLHSAGVIRDRLAELSGNRATIVMGDLNVHEDNAALQVLLGSESDLPLIDSYRQVHPEISNDEATFNGYRGVKAGKRIDFVLTTDRLRATDARIVRRNFDGVYPSDHYPVVVTLETAD